MGNLQFPAVAMQACATAVLMWIWMWVCVVLLAAGSQGAVASGLLLKQEVLHKEQARVRATVSQHVTSATATATASRAAVGTAAATAQSLPA